MFNQFIRNFLSPNRVNDSHHFLIGSSAVQSNRSIPFVNDLRDVELSVFSQWGEDGIIDWLIHLNGTMPETFIEFGVENYTESNTRFLLQNRNWRGLIIDGSENNIKYIIKDPLYWKHNLCAVHSFITAENINSIILDAGFSDEIGILSIDIDGNDYWVWDAISCISPHILIVEYNSSFGNMYPLSIPYSPSFKRTNFHHSNLYYGTSISALLHLAANKDYTYIGCNSAGSNAFFIRNDRLKLFSSFISSFRSFPSKFRESRSTSGHLNFISGINRTHSISHLPVVNVITNETHLLSHYDNLFSDEWLRLL